MRSVKFGELLAWLRNCQLQKKAAVPWNSWDWNIRNSTTLRIHVSCIAYFGCDYDKQLYQITLFLVTVFLSSFFLATVWAYRKVPATQKRNLHLLLGLLDGRRSLGLSCKMRNAALHSIPMFCNGLTQAYQDWIQGLALCVVRYKFISLLLWNVRALWPPALDTVLLQKGSAARRNNSWYKAWISIYAKLGE